MKPKSIQLEMNSSPSASSGPFSETSVNFGCGAFFETLDDHVKHGSCSGGRAARNILSRHGCLYSNLLALEILRPVSALRHLRECVRREFQVFARMRGGDLRADTRGAVWNDRIKEADHVNAFLQHARGELLRLRCVANHDRDDRMHAGLDRQAALGQRSAEKFCVFLKLVAQFGRCAEKLERFQRSSDNWWRDCVGK